MNYEETIFEHALGIREDQARNEFLRAACRDDDAMFDRLQGLLRAYDRAGKFLEHSTTPEKRVSISRTELASWSSPPLNLPLTEKPGDRIGRYKLLQKIGEGGCGVVYMAEQEQPVRRRVALKIIKLGMDTRQVIARFEAERQALALMEHPNIAKVYDAGSTETGRPYFVMELVRGVKITDFCDEKKLTTLQRLELFTQVCRTVQHAHQKGIIHRDLKPSNILVSFDDGVARPKIIDFGIAKATSGEPLTDQTVFTAFEQFIGTPAYMAPEQALVTNVDVDTRADIYALGVLLYELLTGHTPFNPKELMKGGVEEMRRTICQREPQRPSTRLSTLSGEELSTTAQRRSLDPPKLVSQLRGDLDWIVMKCLEKDRARRYETANGLATDIQRYLNNEPVTARPPSNLYRFQKMVRRNRLVVAASCAVIAALVLGLGLASWMFIRERGAARRASIGERKAEIAATNSFREAEHARLAEAEAKEKLRDSYFSQAQARRLSRRMGRRFEALDALKKAAEIRPDTQLRHEAISCMALMDCRVIKEWQARKSYPVGLCFDAEYQRYATLDAGGKLTVRRMENSQELFALFGFAPPLGDCQFSPDGHWLAAKVGQSQYLRVWDLERHSVLFTVTNGVCISFAFSKDNRFLAIACDWRPGTNRVFIYDRQIVEAINSFEEPLACSSLAFSPSAHRLAICDADNPKVDVRETGTGRIAQTFLHPQGIFACAWQPEGPLLATACLDGRLYLWHTGTEKLQATLSGHEMAATTVQFSHRGDLIVSGSWDGTTRFWDPIKGQELLSMPSVGSTYHFSSDDKFLAHDSSLTNVALLEVARGDCVRLLNSQSTARTCVSAISPDGDWVASHDYPDGVRIWNIKAAKEVYLLPDTQAARLDFTPNSNELITGDNWGIRTWPIWFDRGGNHFSVGNPTVISSPGKNNDYGSNPDHSLLAHRREGRFQILQLRTQKKMSSFDNPKDFDSIALSQDGQLAALWRWDGTTADIWDVARTNRLTNLPTGYALYCAFSPDNRWLVTGDNAEDQIWSTRDWHSKHRIARPGPPNYRGHVAFSADSSILATTHSRTSVRLTCVETGEELAMLDVPDVQMINWLSLDAKGEHVAVSCLPQGIWVWDLRRIRQQLAEMKLDWNLPPYPQPVLHDKGPFAQVQIDESLIRDSLLSLKLIDLSAHYNSVLIKLRHHLVFHLTNDCSTFPKGVVTLAGTQFDVRGIVQLLGSESEKRNEPLPKACREIRVSQTCHTLHFLHATRYGEQIETGTLIGQYVLHYSDGLEHVIPIKYGEDLRSWWRLPNQPETATRAEIAWRDDNPLGPMRLFKLTVENPRPKATIETIDFVSAMTAGAPLLVAITLE